MDNPALQAAVLDPTPTLLVYSFEPMLLKNDHYDNRHWQVLFYHALSPFRVLNVVCMQRHDFHDFEIECQQNYNFFSID